MARAQSYFLFLHFPPCVLSEIHISTLSLLLHSVRMLLPRPDVQPTTICALKQFSYRPKQQVARILWSKGEQKSKLFRSSFLFLLLICGIILMFFIPLIVVWVKVWLSRVVFTAFFFFCGRYFLFFYGNRSMSCCWVQQRLWSPSSSALILLFTPIGLRISQRKKKHNSQEDTWTNEKTTAVQKEGKIDNRKKH